LGTIGVTFLFRRIAILAGAFEAQAGELAEELRGGIDAVLQRFDDQVEQAVVLVAKDLVVALALDRVDDGGQVAVADEDVVRDQAGDLARVLGPRVGGQNAELQPGRLGDRVQVRVLRYGQALATASGVRMP
jgi:hypothetical protein